MAQVLHTLAGSRRVSSVHLQNSHPAALALLHHPNRAMEVVTEEAGALPMTFSDSLHDIHVLWGWSCSPSGHPMWFKTRAFVGVAYPLAALTEPCMLNRCRPSTDSLG